MITVRAHVSQGMNFVALALLEACSGDDENAFLVLAGMCDFLDLEVGLDSDPSALGGLGVVSKSRPRYNCRVPHAASRESDSRIMPGQSVQMYCLYSAHVGLNTRTWSQSQIISLDRLPIDICQFCDQIAEMYLTFPTFLHVTFCAVPAVYS